MARWALYYEPWADLPDDDRMRRVSAEAQRRGGRAVCYADGTIQVAMPGVAGVLAMVDWIEEHEEGANLPEPGGEDDGGT